MDVATESGIENSLEHKFARDLIRFVLHENWPSLQWKPTGIFLEPSFDSPFTPQFQDAVMRELEYSKHRHQAFYEKYFSNKSILRDKYYELLSKAKDVFVNNGFHPKYLVEFSVLLAKFAGFSYFWGLTTAPEQSYELLVAAMRELKLLGRFEDSAWDGVQDWLESGFEEAAESFDESEEEANDFNEMVQA
ncbi:hypothetical protein HNY73_009139 [Argiope bruennichi]|uniref:Uncharacterized protein n=1 Tax=Argiope bruennichi TaxID=94029 RepID=A0A8T0F8M2_ARGBR|nr:hypothetical protein HNY73_009139 [Argiope bruennichi]